jgi:hypothetical protein
VLERNSNEQVCKKDWSCLEKYSIGKFFAMDDDESDNKRRRIIINDDDDDEEVISNPDELLDDNNADDEEGEDLNENWIEYDIGPLHTSYYLLIHFNRFFFKLVITHQRRSWIFTIRPCWRRTTTRSCTRRMKREFAIG